MKKTKLFLLPLAFFAFILVSCNKEEDKPKVNESEVLATYLESTGSPLMKDFVNTDMPTIVGASEVKTLNETGQVYIMDIRSAADFALGHIANAKNVALGNIVAHLDSVDQTPYTKVAVVCYTGQTAGYAACLLRLLGNDKVFSMKWGMCAWNAEFAGKWNTAISTGNAYAAQFTTTATEKGDSTEMPSLSTGMTTGQEILEARVAALLAEGFTPASVTAKTVFDNLSSYYIINYWPASQYADPGHIPGAIQYTPKESMKLAAALKTLPTDKPIAVYCYTGMTSAYLVAYLRLLGYDAKSVLYGANGMIYDQVVSKSMTNWSVSQIMGYDYVQ